MLSSNRKITQAQIAKELGISQSAVSLTLNDPGTKRVSDETRKRVLDFVQLNSPNSLPTRQRTICFLVPAKARIENVFTTRLLDGTEFEGKAFNCQILFKRWATEEDVTRLAQSPLIEGVIHMGYMPEEVLQSLSAAKPTIIVNHLYPELICDMVSVDNQGGIQQALRHLMDLGHRNIGYIDCHSHGSGLYGHAAERIGGYYEGLITLGLPVNPDNVVIKREYDRAATIFLEGEVTAAVAFNDGAALALIQALAAKGVSVPEDFSVVGFDNSEHGVNAAPPLTTIHQEREQMGRQAVRLLVERLEQGSLDTLRKVLCRTELIVRESTGPAKQV